MASSDYIRHLRARVGHDLLMVPSVSAYVLSDDRVLLLRTRDGWTLPGGAVDTGEQPLDSLVREVREEAGIDVMPGRIIALYGGMAGRRTYRNGDQVEYVDLVFLCTPLTFDIRADGDEAAQACFWGAGVAPVPWTFPVPFAMLWSVTRSAGTIVCQAGAWAIVG